MCAIWDEWEQEGWEYDENTMWPWWWFPGWKGWRRGRWRHRAAERAAKAAAEEEWRLLARRRRETWVAYRDEEGWWVGSDGRRYWSEDCLTPRD